MACVLHYFSHLFDTVTGRRIVLWLRQNRERPSPSSVLHVNALQIEQEVLLGLTSRASNFEKATLMPIPSTYTFKKHTEALITHDSSFYQSSLATV